MQPTRLALLIPLLSILALSSSAQQPPAPPQDSVPTLHVTSRIVVLDVVVNDASGHPSTGLKPSEFILTEDGVPQTILSMAEHDAAKPPAASDANSDLPPNTIAVRPPANGNGAVTIIVLDNIEWHHRRFVHDQVAEFLRTAPITMPIAVFRQDGGMHLIQGLTTDRAVLAKVAASPRLLPLSNDIITVGSPIDPASNVAPQPQLLQRYLAAIPGRINLVWFGESLPPVIDENDLFPDLDSRVPGDLAALMRSQGDSPALHRVSRIALYPVIAAGLIARLPCLTQACSTHVALNAGFDSIPCIDLMNAAISAGGHAFCNTNGFKEALTTVVETGAHYYTISYRPTNPDWNGKFRNIKVDVASNREKASETKIADWLANGPSSWNYRIAYRDGYYANIGPASIVAAPAPITGPPAETQIPQRKLISVSPRGQGTLARTGMDRSMAFGALTPNQLHFTVVMTPAAEVENTKPGEPLPPNNFLIDAFHDAPYRNCRIHYWIEPQDLHFAPTASGAFADTIQFVAMIYRDDGLIVNSISYTSHIQISPEQLEDIQSNGLTFDQTIAIPASAIHITSDLFLRAGVNELSTSHIGAIETPVEWIKPASPAALQAQTK